MSVFQGVELHWRWVRHPVWWCTSVYITSFLLHAACGVFDIRWQDHTQKANRTTSQTSDLSLVTSEKSCSHTWKRCQIGYYWKNMRMLQYNICTVCLYTHSNVSNSLLQVKATIAHQRLKWTPTQQESNEAFKTICFFHWDPQRKTSICNPCGHHPTPNQPHWAAAPHALWHHINRIRVDRVGATVIPGPRMQWYNKSGQRKHVMCAKFTSNVENHWV